MFIFSRSSEKGSKSSLLPRRLYSMGRRGAALKSIQEHARAHGLTQFKWDKKGNCTFQGTEREFSRGLKKFGLVNHEGEFHKAEE